jgi:hypothetical protein
MLGIKGYEGIGPVSLVNPIILGAISGVYVAGFLAKTGSGSVSRCAVVRQQRWMNSERRPAKAWTSVGCGNYVLTHCTVNLAGNITALASGL